MFGYNYDLQREITIVLRTIYAYRHPRAQRDTGASSAWRGWNGGEYAKIVPTASHVKPCGALGALDEGTGVEVGWSVVGRSGASHGFVAGDRLAFH